MKKNKLKNLDCANCDLKVEPEVEVLENELKKSELVENKIAILKASFGLFLLLLGFLLKDVLYNTPFHCATYLVYGTAYLIVGWDVVAAAVKNIIKGQVFNEHFLMAVATIGAFAINAMPEAVAVMLFYVIGELFQDIAVGRSRKSIKALLQIKPEFANLMAGSDILKVSPEDVKIGDIILVKAGEKIPLDSVVMEGKSYVDTSVLTGESVPRKINVNDEVLAGMINQSGMITLKVRKAFNESSISRILELVENATSRKAQTEKFITTFAKYYTPVVVIGALFLAILPPLLVEGQTFADWIYRALVVLVVSCPCALVISIPLGYFGGIGRASKNGILIKGSNFMDALTQVKTVVFDKTGTLTKGEFKVSEIVTSNGFTKEDILEYAAYAEIHSNHPVAKSISEAFGKEIDLSRIKKVEEISGHGIKAIIDDKTVIAGNDKFLHLENIDHPVCNVEGSVVHLTIDGVYAGYILISDTLKEDAIKTIQSLKAKNIQTVMLTGDNAFSAEIFAKKLKIDAYFYELLPEDKVKHLERLMMEQHEGKVAFVGDGINDAPVIARADIGIAMGALGSDAAIETADVVLMTDSPSKVVDAIDVAQKTRNIIWQNIVIALGVKLFFITLGVFGIATMWEAVFGDMGVALIAVFNSIRILKK